MPLLGAGTGAGRVADRGGGKDAGAGLDNVSVGGEGDWEDSTARAGVGSGGSSAGGVDKIGVRTDGQEAAL